MNTENTRNYSPPELTALNHPTRIALLDLIRDGVNSTPEMAIVLHEDRTNLYHHLSKLEGAGLIESSYDGNRIKRYILKNEQNREIQSIVSLDSHSEWFTRTHTVVLTPPKSKNASKKFKKAVKDLYNTLGLKFSNDHEILQIQVISQPKQIIKDKQEEIKRMKIRNKNN